jgi:tetratricopeptide (TPR) repeat protein
VDDELNEFVVCPSCGTRIKAGREFCLRCFGPLPTAERPIKPPVWESLGLSDTKKQIVVGAVALVVIGLGAVIYMTEPPAVDEVARPASAASAPRAAAAPAAAATPATPPATEPASPAAPDTSGVAIYQPLPRTAGPALMSADVETLDAKRKTLEAELAKSPDDVGLLNDVAVSLDRLGRAADAVPRFERAVALAPDQARLRLNFAHALIAVGLWDRAVTELRAATRLQPNDFFAQYTLAQTLHQKGDDQGAVTEFQKAAKLGPNESNVHLSFGIALETVGRRDEAVQEYKRYLALQPSSDESDRLREHLQALGVVSP